MDKYNGWANYHTWNVSLWIANDEMLYNEARLYAQAFMNQGSATYAAFIAEIVSDMPYAMGYVTPDGVSWTDPHLDHEELDVFIRELAD